MVIYMFRVILPGETEEVIKEFSAPSFTIAVEMAAQRWPGIHLVKFEGTYDPATKGTA